MVSVDSLDPMVYSVVRRKGVLSKTLTTIDALMTYRNQRKHENRPFNLVASFCVQKINWVEIPKFIEFCKHRELLCSLQFLYEPSRYSILTLPIQKIEEIYTYLKTAAMSYGESILSPILNPLREALENSSSNLEMNQRV